MLLSEKDVETPYSAVPSDGKCVPPEYQALLPEAQNIFWNDDFFDDEEGIVAVFDFDYDQMLAFELPIAAISQGIVVNLIALYAGLFTGIYGIGAVLAAYLLLLYPCLLQQQVRWKVMANHVAITRDGIRLVQDRRKSCWGFSMCDKGKHSKTVPFDKITDCDIMEPAGNQYLCIKRVLYVVNVDTASSGSEGNRHELCISGLKEPHKFKALVWAMKRAPHVAANYAALPTATVTATASALQQLELPTLTKSPSTSSQSSNGVVGLLKSIRNELRENNDLLRKMYNSDRQAPPTGEMM